MLNSSDQILLDEERRPLVYVPIPVKRVLSIQMQSIGHKTYGELLRYVSNDVENVQLDSFWAADDRSLVTKIIRRLSEIKIPVLNRFNLDFRRARGEWSTGRMSRLLVKRKLKSGHYDALHFHTQTAGYGNAGLMKRIPTFVTMDMTTYQLQEEHNSGLAWTHYPNLIMERNVLAAAKHIVTFSDWARRSVISGHKISPDRVSTITPGVKIEKFPPPIYGRSGKPRILFVGNDFIRKGGDDLLAVFLEKFTETATLHLVTNHPVKIAHPSVTVHPGIAAYTQEWHRLYQASEIFVMASRAEALGLVFQEAAASGLALIGTTVGGIPEMITHGGNGFLIAPGDRNALATYLQILIEDHELRQTMRKESRARAIRDFDGTANGKRLMELFRSKSI